MNSDASPSYQRAEQIIQTRPKYTCQIHCSNPTIVSSLELHWLCVRAGLAVDLSSVNVSVYHPIDPEAADLPPCPILLVATSDGKLRFYTWGHMQRDLAGVVRTAAPLPQMPNFLAAAASKREPPPIEGISDAEVGRAAATALPSDTDPDLEEGGEEEGTPQPDEDLLKAATTALPLSSDEEEDADAELRVDSSTTVSEESSFAKGLHSSVGTGSLGDSVSMLSLLTVEQPLADQIEDVDANPRASTGWPAAIRHSSSPAAAAAGAAALARHATDQPAAPPPSLFGKPFSFTKPADAPRGFNSTFGAPQIPPFGTQSSAMSFGGPQVPPLMARNATLPFGETQAQSVGAGAGKQPFGTSQPLSVGAAPSAHISGISAATQPLKLSQPLSFGADPSAKPIALAPSLPPVKVRLMAVHLSHVVLS